MLENNHAKKIISYNILTMTLETFLYQHLVMNDIANSHTTPSFHIYHVLMTK